MRSEQFHSEAWYNKGNGHFYLRQYQEAIECYNQVLALDPQKAGAWNNKALAEEGLGRSKSAAYSYKRFIELAQAHDFERIEHARQRLRELEGN